MPATEPPVEPERQRWRDKLRSGLRKTGAGIAQVFTSARIDDALAVGDAWLPGDISLAPNDEGVLEGAVQLVAPTSEIGLGGKLVRGAEVVVGAMERSAWSVDDAGIAPASTEDPMAEDTSAAARVLEDAPVVVRVEIGAARMTAREWSAISEGDVVTLDRRITDPVSLRVGGVEIARGELVHIEGELGVRVTSRVTEPS